MFLDMALNLWLVSLLWLLRAAIRHSYILFIAMPNATGLPISLFEIRGCPIFLCGTAPPESGAVAAVAVVAAVAFFAVAAFVAGVVAVDAVAVIAQSPVWGFDYC